VGKGIFTGANKMEMQAGRAIDQLEESRKGLKAGVEGEFAQSTGGAVAQRVRGAADKIVGNDDRAKYLRKRAAEFEFQPSKRIEQYTVPPEGTAGVGTKPMRPAKARTGQDTMFDPDNAERFAPTQVDLPDGVWPRPGPPAGVQGRRVVDTQQPRLYSLDQLGEGRRENSPAKWSSDSQAAESQKAIHQAFSDTESDVIGRFDPVAGNKYRKLAREEAALIQAQQGLLGADSGGLPAGVYDAGRKLVRGGAAKNLWAKGVEGTAAASGPVGRMATSTGNSAVRNVPAASLLSRQAVQKIQSAEYPEDEYYRQYMSNPDFALSNR
jgi:hypothetical protein